MRAIAGVATSSFHTRQLASGVASHAHKNWGDQYTHATIQVRILAVIMMLMAIGIALYAAYNFQLRANMLQ